TVAEFKGSALRLDVQADIAVVTFDTPGSRANTLGQAVLGEFEGLLSQLEGRKDLHGLILRSGKPGMFIAGADLKELGSAVGNLEQAQKLIRRGHGIINRFETLPFPTVAAIDGACMGGGLEVALGMDYRVASDNPKTDIGFPETKVGIIPGWGGTQRLPRLMGPALAAELICAGDSVPAQKALGMGIVSDVVPADRLLEAARDLLKWSR